MLDTLAAIATITGFLLTLFLKRKEIAANIREVATPSISSSQSYTYPSTGATSKSTSFLKSLVAILGSSLGFMWDSIAVQLAFRPPYSLPTSTEIYWHCFAIIVGLWFGASYLRKQSWTFITISLLVMFFVIERLFFYIYQSIWY